MSPIQNTPTGEEAVTVAFSPTLGVLIAKHLTIWLLTLWTSVTATLYPKARGFTMYCPDMCGKMEYDSEDECYECKKCGCYAYLDSAHEYRR